jgi:hypothetical protein
MQGVALEKGAMAQGVALEKGPNYLISKLHFALLYSYRFLNLVWFM